VNLQHLKALCEKANFGFEFQDTFTPEFCLKLLSIIEIQGKTLEFYANEENWHRKTLYEKHFKGMEPDIANKISMLDLSRLRGGEGHWFKVAGAKAREALAQIERIGKGNANT